MGTVITSKVITRTFPSLEVRQASMEDVNSLRHFLLTGWKEAGPSRPGWTGASEEIIKDLATEESLRGIISNSKIQVFQCSNNESIVGIAVNRALNLNTVELAGVIVLESQTGKGIGSKLVGFAKAKAVEMGFEKMLVKTEVSNTRAIKFYEKEGFHFTTRTLEDVKGTNVDLQNMQCELIPAPIA